MRSKATLTSYTLTALVGTILSLVVIHRELQQNQCIRHCIRTSPNEMPRLLEHRDVIPEEYIDTHREMVDDLDVPMEEFIPVVKPFTGFHKAEIDNLRVSLIEETRSMDNMFATQQNIQRGGTVHFAETKKWSLQTETAQIPDIVYNILPRANGLKPAQFQSCSLVGNGGILNDGRCGRQIDSSDYVFRSNFSPVGGAFAGDVGSKTDFITINPSVFDLYNKLTTEEDESRFLSDLAKYGEPLLYTHPFRLYDHAKISQHATSLLKKVGRIRQVRASHPDFLLSVASFWKRRGLQELRPTTGLLLLAVSLSLCEQVTLYGFWPFSEYNGRPVSYHYFDRPTLGTREFKDKFLERELIQHGPFHNFTEEFLFLNRLHDRGVINIQVEPCS
ncbi:alpha-2,8-sialyltransferase 8F-like [Branchiostoma lanceolatum]|uniref:alpha-2,8-sialyltransferase 8F-like n=1 Tax=Branchiostoma lanceolatum TaxID=7740 RepID=UPI00345417D4